MINKGYNEQYLSSTVIDCAHLRIDVSLGRKKWRKKLEKLGVYIPGDAGGGLCDAKRLM